MQQNSDLRKIILRIGLIVLLVFLLPDFLEHLTYSNVITFFREGTPFERFALLLFVVLIFPPLCEKIGIPGIIGLIGAGIILGPHVMKIGAPNMPGFVTLYSLGKVFLLFLIGLEIDMDDFQKKKGRSMLFGVFSLGFPLLTGIFIGKAFGYSWNSSVLIGSLFASHTLIGLPIIQKLKLAAKEFWTVTVGATILTDIVALLILGVCIMVHMGGFSFALFGTQILQLVIYCFVVLVGFSWLSETLLKNKLKSEESQFLYVFIIIIVASVGAQLIHLEDIVGAFLAGIAVNRALKKSPVKEKLRFFASTIFVPIFFIIIGAKIDFHDMEADLLAQIGLVSALIVGFFLAKYAAAYAIGKIYKYSRTEVCEIWSLSMPQVAATLTAAFVAYEKKNAAGVRLIDDAVLYSIFILMIITVIVGPILTERFGKRIVSEDT
ncbi:cation:proton antiporter [Candidatus Omnitrophota bacterium]